MKTWKDRRCELAQLYLGSGMTLLDVLDLARRETLSDSSMDSYAQGRTEGLRRGSAQGLSSAEKEIADLEGYKRGRRDGYKRGWDESEANLRIRIERLFGGEK
jgi:hypothetical protein